MFHAYILTYEVHYIQYVPLYNCYQLFLLASSVKGVIGIHARSVQFWTLTILYAEN